MSSEANKAVVHRVFEEWFATGDDLVADQLYAEDYQHHDPSLPPEAQHGREAYKQGVKMFYTAFPDATMTYDQLIAEGDKVAMRWSFAGTHQGQLMGIPPTGRPVTITGIQILRLDNGKIVEGWANFDALGLMQQLGVVPAQDQAA